MATKKQKEELMEALKFTPCTYTLNISGYGGETYAGVVDRKIYEYFKEKEIDISQFANSWDEDLWRDVPDDLMPFTPGSPYECDSIFHMSGAELSSMNYITVTDENNETQWENSAGYSELEDAGVTVECTACNEIADQDKGVVVFWGGQGEKGCFFDGEILLRAPFDPKKLTIYYEDCDGWDIISSVEYDGEEIDGSNGYSTTGKWSDAKWIIVGDKEEVYEGVERDNDYNDHIDEEADEGLSAFQQLANTIAESREENWTGTDTKPPAKGSYECKFVAAVWPLGDVRTAEWTGRSWKENGKKAPEMIGWREVEEE